MRRVSWSTALAMVFAISCAKTETLGLGGGLVVPEVVDVGDCGAGMECELVFELLNTSDSRITILDVETDDAFDVFDYEFGFRGTPQAIDAQSSAPMRMTFTPFLFMNQPASSTIVFVTVFGRVSTTLRGRGVQAIEIDPVLDFGAVPRGSSTVRQLIIRNLLDVSLNIRRLSPSPPSPGGGQFEMLTLLDDPLLARGTLTVPAGYTPDADDIGLGRDQTTWTFTYCEFPERCEVKVELLGEPIDAVPTCLRVTPPSIDFGRVAIGDVETADVIVENVCDHPLAIFEINADTARTGAFLTNNGPASIGAGEFYSVTVVFAPHGNRTFASELSISADDVVSPNIVVPLRGEGIIPEGPCELALHAPALDFGEVEIMRTQTAALVVENIGPSVCLLGPLALAGVARAKFQIVAKTSTLTAGEAGFIEISYTPTEAVTDETALSFTPSPSPSPTPIITVMISGTGTANTPVIYPDRIDFGALRAAAANRSRELHIFNHRDTPLTIDRIRIGSGSSADFQFSTAVVLPLELAPFEQHRLELEYTPQDVVLDTAVVQIYEVGHLEPYTVWLIGRDGIFSEEIFTQPLVPAVDVVFVVDPSLQLPLADFRAFANASGADYTISTTTVGTDILRTAQHALRAPLLFEPNAPILRRDAGLAIVFVTDKEDTSPGEVQRYAGDYLRIHGARNKNALSFHTVTGGPAGCVAPGINAEAALRFVDLSLIAPGAYESICADWSTVLGSIATGIFSPRSYFVRENVAVSGTTSVYFNGLEIPRFDANGQMLWSDGGSNNLVSFSAIGTPPPGTEIRITYRKNI